MSASIILNDQHNAIVGKYFSFKEVLTPATWTTQPCKHWNGCENDDALIEKSLTSKSANSVFGSGASFKDLWERNVKVLSDTYSPHDNDAGDYDESSADAALALQLAFWTGKDCARIERLMWQSNLARDKWTKHKTYLSNTIKNAVALCRNVYGQSVQAANSAVSVDSVEVRTGFQFLIAAQQVVHFSECVYIRDLNKIYTPDGSLVNREQFNATFGGYIFEMDSGGSGKTTRKAWEAFTESQAINYPWAHGVCFRPELLK